jgi:hypothetical protein
MEEALAISKAVELSMLYDRGDYGGAGDGGTGGGGGPAHYGQTVRGGGVGGPVYYEPTAASNEAGRCRSNG